MQSIMLTKKVLTAILVLFTAMAAQAQLKINFTISFTEPQAHYAEVEMNMEGLANKAYIDVKMPTWTPGSYLIREFAKNVESLKAQANSKTAQVEKLNKNTWRIFNAKANAVKVYYRVYAFEVSVRTAFVDESHAFLSPASVFLYPAGMLASPSTITIVPFGNWDKVSTGLAPVAGKPFTYTASNFDVLFDSPLEVGNQDVFEFNAAGVRHEVAMVGGGNYDKERLKVDMAKIVEEATKIYGENPNTHYTFIVHNRYRNGGGLEHLNSTVLGASRDAYATEEGHQSFLELVAHEYFHLWNVKRLRPVALGPFDYDNEVYTTNLWVAEGFTSYYENKLMLRAGFKNEQAFLTGLAGALGTVLNTPGAKYQSAASSSFDAWIIGYRPNENSKNSAISYYNKGEIVGLLMDLEIANATNGLKSLDDVMKLMYYRHKQPNPGYTDAQFKTMVEKVAGKNFDDFWKKYVNGVDDIDYKKYFNFAGVNIVNQNEDKNQPYFGATVTAQGVLVVTGVARASGAWNGGVNVNDILISIDDVPAEASIEKMAVISNKNIGDEVTVKVIRDGLPKVLKVKLTGNPTVKFSIGLNEKATPKQLAVRKKWMGL